MLHAIELFLACIFPFLRTRRSLLLENLVLRQQLAVLKRRHPRPRLAALDRLFWIIARRLWSGWKQALIIVTPETVVRWIAVPTITFRLLYCFFIISHDRRRILHFN